MPEEVAEETLAAGTRGSRRKVGPVALVGAVLVVAMAAAGYLILQGPPPGTKYVDKREKQQHPKEILDIPALETENIPLSVPLEAAGAQRKALTVAVAVRFAPPEGADVNVKGLQKEFIPRVGTLNAEFRHLIIQEINTKDYSKLSDAAVRDQVLKTLKRQFNEKLREYGLYKMARVQAVLWKNFYWQ